MFYSMWHKLSSDAEVADYHLLFGWKTGILISKLPAAVIYISGIYFIFWKLELTFKHYVVDTQGDNSFW